MLRLFAIVVSVTFIASPIHAAPPQSSDATLESIRRDMDELIRGQLDLQKEVRELRTMLQNNPACGQPAPAHDPPPNTVIDVAGAPAKGNEKAPFTVIEFSDFQCPFSAKFNAETFAQFERDYIASGKVRYVFRNFPLVNMHAMARQLAIAGHCANEQNKFWQMRGLMFTNQAVLTNDASILEQAKQVGLDLAALQKCIADVRAGDAITKELNDASAAGVSGTPTFFIARTETSGTKVKPLRMLVGVQTYDALKQVIDAVALPQPSPSATPAR